MFPIMKFNLSEIWTWWTQG